MAVIEAIATTYLEADAASVTFSSIPATYEHLQLRISMRTTRTSWGERCMMWFNGDTGTNYSNHRMQGTATTTGASGETGVTYTFATYWMPTGFEDAAIYGSSVCDILDYRNGSKNTTVMNTSGEAAMSTPYMVFQSGLWDNVAAVTTILLAPQYDEFARGTEISLYGLKSS